MKNKRPRRRRVILIILAVLIILAATLLIWQRNNLKALINFATQSQEELEANLEKNNQAIRDAVEAVPGLTVPEITDEDRQALRDGTLTLDDLLNRLTGSPEAPEPSDTPSPAPTQTPEPSAPPAATAAPTPTPTPSPTPPPASMEDYEAALNELIARVYVLREKYLLELEALEREAILTWQALPPAHRNASYMAPLIKDFLARAIALEADCDRQMDTIVVELEALLKKYNQDLSLVDTVKYTYANEKSLKKALYMSKLQERGLI